MKSPGVIYRRYRQIKKKILYDRMYSAHLRLHENCHYGQTLSYVDNDGVCRIINVCKYNKIEGNQIEICDNPNECNAFALKWTKEKIIEETNRMLSDWDTKKTFFPEITILEWILDKDLYDASRNPGFLGRIIIKCINILEYTLKNINNKQRK